MSKQFQPMPGRIKLDGTCLIRYQDRTCRIYKQGIVKFIRPYGGKPVIVAILDRVITGKGFVVVRTNKEQ